MFVRKVALELSALKSTKHARYAIRLVFSGLCTACRIHKEDLQLLHSLLGGLRGLRVRIHMVCIRDSNQLVVPNLFLPR